MTRDDILDTNELADILGVKREAIRQRVNRHQLPRIKVGNTLIFHKADLVKWGILDGYIDGDGHVYCLKKP
jgi:excisionase family DNA binding protein